MMDERARVGMLRGLFDLYRRNIRNRDQGERRGADEIWRLALSTGEREDEEIVLAGDDDGEKAAVGRDGEFTEGEPVKGGCGWGLSDGDFISRGSGHRRGEIDPD
jgi:hypothetical protein